MKKNVFEIYLTSEYVQKEDWLKLFLKVSKINGILRTWNLWIQIENNYIRYFIEMKRGLPPVFGELGSFLFKKIDSNLKEKSVRKIPCLLTSSCKTVVELYDKNETKKMQQIKKVKITFYPHKYDSYLSTTRIYLKTQQDKLIRKKVFFNFCIHEFVSVNFGIHTRFFYSKDKVRYLETKKVINLLNSNKEKAIVKANVFPYLQEDLYLKQNNYDFEKHSMVIGASRHRKI